MTATRAETATVRLQLTCMQPPDTSYLPESTIFGLQDRQQNVHSGQQNPDSSISYDIEVPVERTLQTDSVRFRGPYVHGTPTVPFLYLSLKRLEGEQASWIRRLKIPLPMVTWDEIDTVAGTTLFVARIAGTGSGTVPLLNGGWTKRDNHHSM
ncbi:hypothetical protein KDA_50730 [Dictyobacter alpinus]|uniref:Uncharacterized protein n=1 Tax=Dictyobacter alpinus TaxID=2014873 RepID=A0A402BE38_9CHLR|nr:DUF5990 family protein [Dictyobacter alpinus]GCE29589.1 hypothetical protein KDA_50730 [Dictyobacter alpinus]